MTTRIDRVLVYGANGVQGRAVAKRLHEEGFSVRAGARDAAKSEALRRAGIEVVRLDLDDPASVASASEGMHAVVLTLPLEWNRSRVLAWTETALAAAGRSGVQLLVVNSSTRIPQAVSRVPTFELRREVEALIRSSAVPSTILRPPLFLDNLENPWMKGSIVRERVLPYPIPATLRVSWLAASDLGSFAAAALRHPELAGKTFDVGGPEALGGDELARALAEAVGQTLRYVAVPPDVFERGIAAQFGPDVARDIAGTYHYCAESPHTELLSAASEELKRLLPRPLLFVEQWARAARWETAD